MKLEIQAVMSGYDIKISGEKMLGTLHLDDQGFYFNPPNKKKGPLFFIPWDQLETLIKMAEGFKNAWNS